MTLWQGSGAGYFTSAGPMHNLPGSLAGRCPNLKSLKICKVGERLLGESWPDYSSKDEDLYKEFAIFINSVKPTLREFTFAQGERGVWRLYVPDWRSDRVMDERFRRLLAPTLLSAPWPCLQRMTLHGVRKVTEPTTPYEFTAEKTTKVMDHVGMGLPVY